MENNLTPEEFVKRLKNKGKKKETKLQKKVQDYIESIGGYCFKVHGSAYMKAGIPDVICCYKGYFIGIECKVDNNTMTSLQEEHRDMIVRAGGIHILAYKLEHVKLVIERIKNL